MESCFNCWFYCHSNGRCYADPRSIYDEDYALKWKRSTACDEWKFDGLHDWEREACEPVLVTMENVVGM